jgi:uncharacterized membrane protein YhaH (DUF805 family)
VNFPTAVKSGFRNYATFSGRATRSEFWWFVFFAQLLQAVGQNLSTELATLLWLGLLIPNTSLHFRRLHDTGRSAKWLIWPLVSIGVMILVLVSLILQTTQSITNLDTEKLIDGGTQISVLLMTASAVSLFAGVVFNFVFLILPSESSLNRYGPPAPPSL